MARLRTAQPTAIKSSTHIMPTSNPLRESISLRDARVTNSMNKSTTGRAQSSTRENGANGHSSADVPCPRALSTPGLKHLSLSSTTTTGVPASPPTTAQPGTLKGAVKELYATRLNPRQRSSFSNPSTTLPSTLDAATIPSISSGSAISPHSPAQVDLAPEQKARMPLPPSALPNPSPDEAAEICRPSKVPHPARDVKTTAHHAVGSQAAVLADTSRISTSAGHPHDVGANGAFRGRSGTTSHVIALEANVETFEGRRTDPDGCHEAGGEGGGYEADEEANDWGIEGVTIVLHRTGGKDLILRAGLVRWY
ncbi:hypothetical protein VTI74DRAFT_8147 [Chaetomium olivicolor]